MDEGIFLDAWYGSNPYFTAETGTQFNFLHDNYLKVLGPLSHKWSFYDRQYSTKLYHWRDNKRNP